MASPPPHDLDLPSRIIHREVVQLLQLAVIAVAAFFLTRALAGANRTVTLRNAAALYTRGTGAVGRGDLDEAVGLFRRAVVTHRSEPRYALALADALARQHQNDAARTVLLALRESRPEDTAVNLQLARLAAARQDVTEAISYYRNTLYAPWQAGEEDRRRGIRLELIDFLLAHQQSDAATSELIALSADVPDTREAHAALAARFARAGDRRHALAQYQRVLRAAPDDPTALAGAGTTAFSLGDYELARRYLRHAPGTDRTIVEQRELAELVLAGDPLAARLGARERRARLATNLAYAQKRAAACGPGALDQSPADATAALQAQASALASALRPGGSLDMDAIEEGVELIGRLVQRAGPACPPSLRDRALRLIAERHAAGQP